MRIILLSLALAAFGAGRPSGPGPTEILGWWHGTSTCTRADWNAACHDEIILYEFVATSNGPERILLRASKIVDGKPVPMGDLEVRYAADSATWNGDFANGRVDLRWTYRIHADTLFGKVVLRPELRVGRQVIAVRGNPISR